MTTERDIAGLFAALPAPEDQNMAVVYKLAEVVLTDLHRIADALEALVAKSHDPLPHIVMR